MVALLSVVFCLLLSYVHCENSTNLTPLVGPILDRSTLQTINLNSSSPLPRYGASVGVIRDTTTYGFVILGGSLAYGDDTKGWKYTFDGKANIGTWSELKSASSISSACTVQDKSTMYIYGGTMGKTSNDLYSYDIKGDVLTKLVVTGNTPPTQGATCAFSSGKLWVIGGDCTSEVHSLDTTAKTLAWVNETAPGGPLGRKGASGLLFGDNFLLWGGNCKGDDSDVWNYTLSTKTWVREKATSEMGPDARAYHSAVVDTLTGDDNPTFIIFGGEVGGQTMNDTWSYNLLAKNWTHISPRVISSEKWSYLAPRQMSNVAYVYGRLFIFSGLVSTNTTANDFWELIISSDCFDLTNSCGACVITEGCGWCSGNRDGYQCIPGHDNMPYVNDSCFSLPTPAYTNDLCPPEGFPGWIIALIIVITIFAIGVVWYFVIRCQKKSSGYDQIN